MKKRKKRMYKASLFFIFLFILFFSLPFIYIKFINKEEIKVTDENKLNYIGYSLNDIKIIINDKEILKYALGNDYDNQLMNYINIEGFEIKNINKYYRYSEKNKNVSNENIVKLVNYEITHEFSERLINLVNDKYFIRENLDSYLNYEDESETRKIVEAVNSNIMNDFYKEIKSTDINEKTLLLVNKYYYLNSDFEGLDLVEIDKKIGNGKLNKETYEAFLKMREDASKEGHVLFARSNYRDYNTQNYLYNNYKKMYGLAWADSFSARPGHSEHQTGLAIDVTVGYSDLGSFVYSNEYVWMVRNAHKYGFILRYPEGKEHLTGYNFEPWHYRYVGVEAAKIIKQENLIFEEYHEFFVKNKKTN